jgi:cytidylate kinase
MKKIIISLDGHSGCGKSTLAKLIAKHLKFTYIDTGAMYRAMTLFFVQNDMISDENKLKNGFQNILDKVNIDFKNQFPENLNLVRLNGRVVETEIRTISISNLVSHISKNPIIRTKLITLQQNYALKDNLVMDGRDIGTVVFPNAQIKFWITATSDKRAQRRFLEYQLKNGNVSYDQVLDNIISRDKEDENRKISPLIKPDNSIEIDNSNLDIDQTFQIALSYINQFMSA